MYPDQKFEERRQQEEKEKLDLMVSQLSEAQKKDIYDQGEARSHRRHSGRRSMAKVRLLDIGGTAEGDLWQR